MKKLIETIKENNWKMFKIKLRYFNQISIFLMKNHLEECSKLLMREINLSTNGIDEYSKEKILNFSINI